MRICFVAPFGLGEKTTVWARTLPLARHLVSRGHAVTILIPPWDTPGDAGKCWEDSGVDLVNVAISGGIPATVGRMLRHLQATQPQFVHIVKPRAHAGLVHWWLWQQRRLTKRGPHLFLDVDDWEQAWAAINPYPWPMARFLAWQEEWGIRHADGITAASHWLMDRVHAYTPATPALYLPNGVQDVDTGGVDALTLPTVNRILFFSRFVEVAPLWLATFWQALQRLLPESRLVVAGNALQAGRETIFQETMRQQNPETADRVEWLGYVPTEQLPALYANVVCAIFPTENQPLHQAKCSVKLATTLLHGAPVIASAVGEQAYYGADGAACLVPPDATPAQFATAVAQLVQQPQQRASVRQRARARLLTVYHWEKLGGALEQFYQTAEGL